MLTLAIVPILALNIGLPLQRAAARPGIDPYHVEWENDDLRVARVILAPGERVTADSPLGSVIVFLTADPNGRMPPAEAAWQEAGPIELANHGRARFEAIVISFKRPAPERAAASPPPPVYWRRGMAPAVAAWPLYATGWPMYGYGYERIKSETLVDRPGVIVKKERHPQTAYVEPFRVDNTDTVVVYLRGGEAWPVDQWYPGSVHVHRGDVRVLPANVPYTMSNAGSDPSEFLIVERK